MTPKATAHYGICSHCAGEGDVITIDADPIPLSLCPACLALIISNASGTRWAIREQWTAVNRKRSAQQQQRRVALERKAQENVEKVARADEGNGRVV